MFLVIPASVLIFLLRTQLVRVVLGSLGPGKFDWQDTILTATSLGIFSIGIFASALIPLICRAFFSFKDTKTPTLIAVISVGLNILLSFYLVSVLENPGFVYNSIVRMFDLDGVKNISVLGLPLAFTKAVVFQFILLIIFFHKKVGGFGVKKIAFSLWKIMIAVLLMFASVYFSISLAGGILDTKTFLGVFAQGIISGLVGIAVYLITSIVFKIPEIKIIKSAVLKQFSK
jgi:putative peptidoglycan lipid II flippase